MTNYTDIKPLPYLRYDFIVHLISGILFTAAIFYIFDLFDPLWCFIQGEEIKDAYIDDIFFAFIFFIISYAVGTLITSISSQLIQSNLDGKHLRPFNEYFRKDPGNPIEKRQPSCIKKIFCFLFLFPIWFSIKFTDSVPDNYYDDFFTGSEKEKNRLKKAIDNHWDLSSKSSKLDNTSNEHSNNKEPYAEAEEFLKEKLAFHYIESLSKSHASHHSEFIYGHLIQYSFARNMAFVFSSTTMIVFILLGLNYFHTKCPSFEFINCLLERAQNIICLYEHKGFILFTILAISIFISISFFLRFLDQYKRYTREIYLAFVTEELKKERKNK